MKLPIALLSALAVVTAPVTPSAPPRTLRVCADPNNLPFSNQRLEGFENKIADLVARELGERVEYSWWAQRRGFVRNTLKAKRCDLLVGVASGLGPVLTTRPYYRSTYAFVTRADGPRITSFDDARLRDMRVGVQLIGDDFANAPPAEALTRRGIVKNVRGYTVYGDYRDPSPLSRIVRAVSTGAIDVAIVWGPVAGYFAKRSPVPLRVTPVSPSADGAIPYVFDIAMGVRRGDSAFRDSLDLIIARRQRDIDAILARYGVPIVTGPALATAR